MPSESVRPTIRVPYRPRPGRPHGPYRARRRARRRGDERAVLHSAARPVVQKTPYSPTSFGPCSKWHPMMRVWPELTVILPRLRRAVLRRFLNLMFRTMFCALTVMCPGSPRSSGGSLWEPPGASAADDELLHREVRRHDLRVPVDEADDVPATEFVYACPR